MGERTKLAIRAFQKDNGLDPTGNVDKALVEALLAKN
jgi:localization factor PodJL